MRANGQKQPPARSHRGRAPEGKARDSAAVPAKAPSHSGGLIPPPLGEVIASLAGAGWHRPRPGSPEKLADPVPVPSCGAPASRVGPSFRLLYGRPVELPMAPRGLENPGVVPAQTQSLACAKATTRARAGLTLGIAQTWNLTELSVGDLSSTIALAPGEELTLEFTSSQRKLLEQTTVDSKEELTSTESTTSDKEAINVARASSQTENWRVDGRGSFSLGFVSLGAGASYNKTLTETSQQSVQHVHEATQRSAHSLKTLHKIEVRGVTEGFVQNRMTRIIRNPYLDRTVSVNVFQLIKHFSVQTQLYEVRFAWIVDVDSLKFDGDFVLGQTDFLRNNLLEQSLLDQLDGAVAGAKPQPPPVNIHQAIVEARQALHLLFEEPNVFNVPTIPGGGLDPNHPVSSFDAQLTGLPFGGHQADDRGFGDRAGITDAIDNNFAQIFTTLAMYRVAFVQAERAQAALDAALAAQHRLSSQVEVASSNPFVTLAMSLQSAVGSTWSGVDPKAAELKNILDGGDYTEIFRRLSGFAALVSGIVQPLVQAAGAEEQARAAWLDAQQPLEQILRHLRCNERYYIQHLLTYLGDRTQNQALVDLVESTLKATGVAASVLLLIDPQRAYVDRQQVVVPGIQPLTDDDVNRLLGGLAAADGGAALFQLAKVDPGTITDLEVPADGIHVEVAAGGCNLQGVPEVAVGGSTAGSVGVTWTAEPAAAPAGAAAPMQIHTRGVPTSRPRGR